jgi:mannan endo-1,4-beta-mannosidase
MFGFNCYFLAFCSDHVQASVLLTASRRGANALRVWAFLDVENPGPETAFFQSRENGATVFNDGVKGLERLDHLIHAAGQADVRLILPLLNYWPDFGGVPLYCKWLNIVDGPVGFYRSRTARDAYRHWAEHLLGRRNSVTGRLYLEEPAIMAWELMNEPRGISAADRELLLEWTVEMSRFLKSIDSNHLLALGDEGFFFKRGHGHLYDGTYGIDFEAVLKLPSIDFGTFHFYPQAWGYEHHLEFGQKWISDHLAAGRREGKPVLLQEFGLKLQVGSVMSPGVRAHWYKRWLNLIRHRNGAGALLWMLGCAEADAGRYCDEYTLLAEDELPVFPVES